MMRELLILSGKGGTGKTSLTACFALLAPSPVLMDCDVDASNLPLVFSHRVLEEREFFAGSFPAIDMEKCSSCLLCSQLCRWGAIHPPQIEENCEGCGVCMDNCPEKAITMKKRLCGKLMHSETPYGALFHAHLLPGRENSGKLIAELRRMAKEYGKKQQCQWLISDGPPGIGCPVISAATGTDYAVIVTEPTLSGIHDMRRLATLLRQFEIPFSLIINKADIHKGHSMELEKWAEENRIPLLGKIPFDPLFSEALREGKSILEFAPDSSLAENIRSLWEKIESSLTENIK